MNDLIFPEHKRNANLSRFFRVCSENGAMCWSKQNIDIAVTMAPRKAYAVHLEKLYGAEVNEIKINFTFLCVGGNFFSKLKCCSNFWDVLHKIVKTSLF